MRAFSLLLPALAAAGTLRRSGRGTVAQRRAEPQSEIPALRQIPVIDPPVDADMGLFDQIPEEMPEIGMVTGAPSGGVADHSPESYANMVDYQIAQPTPLPAAFNGVFCKGGACQYRVPPPPPTFAPPPTVPPMPLGSGSDREFCRGLSCIPGMGLPDNPALEGWKVNCVHLFNDVAGGMVGKDSDRSVPQVQESFLNVCKKRVGPLEVGACPAYANTFVGATAIKIDNPTVGGAVEVCADTFLYIQQFKQAEIDMKLTLAALPKRVTSLLNTGVNRFGGGGNGPSSPRGLKWRQFAYSHKKWPTPPSVAQPLNADGGFGAALLQTDAKKPLIPGQDKDADSPRGLPKYKQNPPCMIKKKNLVPQSRTKYQILPGSADGALPPVEVDGELFTYCSNQFSEIMLGFAQTAYETQKLTKDWCTWQASVTTWVGQKEEYGHPDWTHRTCTGMQQLVSFALKDKLSDTTTGISAQAVCKQLFTTIAGVHRTDDIVLNAWQTSLRNPTYMIPKVNDAEMQKLLSVTQSAANELFMKMRAQKKAYDDLTDAKKDTSAYEPNSASLEPDTQVAPDLPDSNDVVLLATSVDRVRLSKRVGVTLSTGLKSFGSWEAHADPLVEDE